MRDCFDFEIWLEGNWELRNAQFRGIGSGGRFQSGPVEQFPESFVLMKSSQTIFDGREWKMRLTGAPCFFEPIERAAVLAQPRIDNGHLKGAVTHRGVYRFKP